MPPLPVAEHGVLHLAVGHFAEVGGHQPLEVGKGVGALQQQLRHVLGDDAGGILDRHQIPAEGHHLAAQGHMCLIEGVRFSIISAS